MMFESSSSPFDEALSKPFLAEPAKKKWSLLSSSTAASTVCTMLSEYYDDDSSHGDESEYADEYEAPTIVDDMDEEVVVFDDDGALLQPMNVEAAILQERHGSFQDVHKSMAQILEIQNDLSDLVECQGDDIENLQSMSIEASEQAQAGVKHLMKINQQREMWQQRRTVLALACIMFVGAFWVFGSTSAGEGGEGPYSIVP